MRNEEIFNLAETHGWMDDFGRWNFKGVEKLMEFVQEILEKEREVTANYIKNELERSALEFWSEIRKDLK